MHKKRHRSRHTTEDSDEACAIKRDRTELEWARRASFVDEEVRQRRTLEMAVEASSFIPASDKRSTTDDAEVAVRTTKSCPIDDLAGSEKSNPPVC